MTTKEHILSEVERALDKVKEPHYGSITIQVNFEQGKRVITIKERETVKEVAVK